MTLAVGLEGRAHATRLVPVAVRDGVATPTAHAGSAMLRGLAAADAVLVVPPEGVPSRRPSRGAPAAVADLSSATAPTWSLRPIGTSARAEACRSGGDPGLHDRRVRNAGARALQHRPRRRLGAQVEPAQQLRVARDDRPSRAT